MAEVLKEINALFSWNPPRLIPDLNKKKSSTVTCPSSFYDKHFSSDLVLKRVKRLPSLVTDLAKNVDTTLDGAINLNSLPPLDDFITARQRAADIRSLSKVVTSEKAVADFYDKTTAKYCSRVASTLALHPTASFSQWDSLLSWTQSTVSSGYAITDGQLCFIEKSVDQTNKAHQEAIVKSIQTKIRPIFEEMRKFRSPLATWEIKSISTGPDEVMTTVTNLGEFSWTTCTDCGTDPKNNNQKAVKLVDVGLDALTPPWSFPDDSLNTDEETDIQPLAPHASSTLPLPPPSASHSSEHASPTKSKGKKRKRDDDNEDEDEAYQGRHDMTAQSLVQQAWAQAVRVDGTVIVLHSGNHELVCLRHRRSQTLYVSDVIEPPMYPGYGKLHVGIYIAAIQDTMDRKQQPQPKSSGDGGDLIGSDKDRVDQDHNRGSGSRRGDGRGGPGGRRVGKSGRFQSSAGRRDPTDGEPVAIDHQNAIHLASNRDVVFLYLQYGVYDSPIPALFLRSAPSIMAPTRCPTPPFSPSAILTCGLGESLSIVLTSEIGRGATGVVHRGTLEPANWDYPTPLDVVVKLAFDIEQRDALRSEYKVYRRLRSKGVHRGIATALGFFDDSEGAACALVMLYAGVPLLTESQGNLSTSDRKLALSTLESIHRAGILHGDIRRENILIGDLGITVIDFGLSKQCDDQRAKDKEIARLRYLLE
ncbi:hypothetical protein BYT27DRAFT_7211721 [Phlegmacium glaucopus]|nr:hypothetical protein BYT27DRAFT_7211721 [Phlegmacium glaucopus]